MKRGEIMIAVILTIAALSYVGTRFQIAREERRTLTEADAVR